MKRARDSQKSKFWKCQFDTVGQGKGPLSQRQVIELIRRVLESHWMDRNHNDVKVGGVRVNIANTGVSMRGKSVRLEIRNRSIQWRFSDYHCHSATALACVARFLHSINDEWQEEAHHGWRFVSIYKGLAERFLDKPTCQILVKNIRLHKLKHRQPRKGQNQDRPYPSKGVEALQAYRAKRAKTKTRSTVAKINDIFSEMGI